jgi:hypothetical protein
MPRHHSFKRLIARALAVTIAIPWPILIPPLPARADDVFPIPLIFIEEVAWAGSSLSTADEWIELANPGTATATVAGWSLRGAGNALIFLPGDTQIPPGGTYRIANYAETDEKSALSVAIHLAITTIALSNSTLGIELLDANGVIIDRAGNGQSPPAGSSPVHATMIRSATSSGDLAASWITATSSSGFKTGLSDIGAPGTCGLCIASPVTPSDIPPEAEEPFDVEPIPDEQTATSTAPDVTVTSTTPVMNVDPVTTTTTMPEIIIPIVTTTTPSVQAVFAPVLPPPPPLHITLSEAMSNPAAGPEWVELRIAETNATATDRALEIWDKSGRFMTVPAHTAITAPGYLVLTLTSARLNNGGDDLSVRELPPASGSSGVVLDMAQIPALEDGVAWAKNDSGSWGETEELTPSGPNRFSAATVVQPTQTTAAPKVSTPSMNAPKAETAATSTSPATTTYTGPPLTILLNEAMSNPDGGKEWVELRIAETDAAMTDRPYELWDASGRIATIPTGTPATSPGYLLVTLASARLNNGGDGLSLREAGGDITLDATDIPALAKGISWGRDEADQWTDAGHPTPGTSNQMETSEGEESIENTGGENEPSSGTSNTKTNAKSDSLTDYENDMPKESLVGARVRLVGTVGSVPRLLGATHAFILLGEDGRAAIAYLPKHLNTPTLGSTVRVMGTLTATERQLELRMKTSDVWMTIATSTPPRPRTVDFLAPGMEDAWGLVSATGTVKTVGTTSFVMDVDAVDVTVSAPAAAGYRTKRLVVGDRVHVTGLLDPRKETSTVIIRVPEDVELTAHAPDTVKPVSTTSDGKKPGGLPDWSPFGATAGAVAMTGGFQRLRSILKRRKLEAMAAGAVS